MTLEAIRPQHFPYFAYDGFTFCLGLQEAGAAWTSGHTAAVHDPARGKNVVRGTMAEQARLAYEKVLTILDGAGLGPADVTRVSENVTLRGLDDYQAAVDVRDELFGAHDPTVRTVVVERLVRSAAHLEIELHAVDGGGDTLVANSGTREPGAWQPSSVTEGHDGLVYLPTLVPVDRAGEVVRPGDLVGQYAWCLERAGDLLDRAGLSLDHAVTTYDYTTPATRDVHHDTRAVRRDLLGGAGVYPAAGSILVSRLHHPEALVALDVTASRHPLELIDPGWSRDEPATCSPGVKAGRTLHVSGFASLDNDPPATRPTEDLAAQAEVVYGALLTVLAHAGLGPADLLETTEYCVVSALPSYRAVAPVRARLLSPPWPTSTGAMCAGLPRPGCQLEVFATALYPEDPAGGGGTT